MNSDDFLESISESEYVYFDSSTGLFFNWNGLRIINVWSTDEEFEIIDTLVVKELSTADEVQEEIDRYIEEIDVD